ncbi:hypothetical protein F4818DRAFT_259868 [Hypoxylon cercidicola]|nr:hypothetical protein F4818DRAFT_259868 [Hypoxylon cercidicola]
MGSYVSIVDCQAGYNITPNCAVQGTNVTNDGMTMVEKPFTKIGDYSKGQFPGDPDIAGIGILGVFVAVTSFAIAAGFASIVWQVFKCYHRQSNYEEKRINRRHRTSFSDILETLVLACSDQQVFTGAAYALTLRYWKGCTISAYHYNIVANMMLLTCATHLISVTIVRNYWKFPWLAGLRVVAIALVFIATGLLMTNQNTEADMLFPTGIPNANETDSPLFLPAACFQSNEHTAVDTFKDTTSNAKAFFVDSIANSTPHNKIQGWNWYIITLLFYGAATIAEIIRFFRRGKSRPGWRAQIGNRFRQCCGLGTPLRKVVESVFLIYLAAGVGISLVVTIISTRYIFQLRSWVNNSGWIQKENNKNPENDATSFGQLVPILTSALIVFSFAQIISEKCTRHKNRKHEGEELPPQDGTIQYLDPSTYDMTTPRVPEKDKAGLANVYIGSSPPRIDLESQSSWGSDLSFAGAQSAMPLLGGDSYFPTFAEPKSNTTGGRAASQAQSVQPGSESSLLPPLPLRTGDETRDLSPTSSRSSGTPQSRSLIGSPNLTQQSASRQVTPSRYSTQPS